jgi:hypothetical protein
MFTLTLQISKLTKAVVLNSFPHGRFWQFVYKENVRCTRLMQRSLQKTCNCSCFEIDQEMDAILLIIDIVYGVCRIVIKLVQQCRYFLFFVNLLLVGVNYGQRTITLEIGK